MPVSYQPSSNLLMPGEHHLSALITSYRSHTLETFTGSMFAAGVKPFDRVNEMPDESAEQSSYDIYRNEGFIPRTLWQLGAGGSTCTPQNPFRVPQCH